MHHKMLLTYQAKMNSLNGAIGVVQTDQRMDQWKAERKSSLFIFTGQLLFAITFSLSTLLGGYRYLTNIPVPGEDFLSKLKFAIQCTSFFISAVVFLSVVNLGFKKLLLEGMFSTKKVLQREQNILTNTIEQTVLFFFLVLSLTAHLSSDQMRLVPLYSILFVSGRLMFIAGYSVDTDYRGFGIMTNFVSTMLIMGYVGHLCLGYWMLPLAVFMLFPMRIIAYAFLC